MPNSILRFNKVCELIGLSRSTLYTRLDPKNAYYDPSFPKPFPYGPRLVCFDKASVDEWIQQHIEMQTSDGSSKSIDNSDEGDIRDA